MSASLRGRRVLVTRPVERNAGLVAELRASGAEAVVVPLVRIEPIAQPPADAAIAYDVVLFTSATAAEFAAGWLIPPLTARVIAVGEATAAALRDRGFDVSDVAEGAGAAGIAAILEGEVLAGKRCLLPQAAGADTFLSGWLRQRGAVVDAVALYRTLPDDAARVPLQQALLAGVDAVTFASPSAVSAFRLFAPTATTSLVACIGETTARAARDAGMTVDVVASSASAAELVSALAARFARTGAAA